MKIKKTIQNENGYIIVVVVVLFLMVLGMMTLATYTLSRGESVAVSNKVERTQRMYSLMGGAEFALSAFKNGKFEDGSLPFTINGIQIFADTIAPTASEQSAYDVNNKLVLNIPGEDGNDQLVVYFRATTSTFANSSVFISGSNNSDVNSGEENTGISPMPAVDTDGLYALALSQGHIKTGNFSASSYLSSFYASGSTPNVTWVTGNLTVPFWTTTYGIFVVEGNVTMNLLSKINGVVYMTSGGSVTMGSLSSVTGGIIGNCSISGSSADIYYNSGYMNVFDSFRSAEEDQLTISNEYKVLW